MKKVFCRYNYTWSFMRCG